MSNVLIVDDEESICWALKRLAGDAGHTAETAPSAEAGIDLAKRHKPDLIMLDVRLPGIDGLSAMQRFNAVAPSTPIVVMTAFGNLETAVTAVRNGAFDYLTKPFDLDQASAVMERALAPVRQSQSKDTSAVADSPDEIVGSGPAMQEVFKRIALVAASDASVLITGESGTGKELVARAIHRHSTRTKEPFVPVHLASLSPTLVESELFGHARGAFTGADHARQGVLELANGATVFFDEAADIPLSTQVKLLRVLEQHELTPVGETQTRPTHFRTIAATSRELRREFQSGAFRQDLYFRLATFEIALPPLRERSEDIPLLVERFLRRVTPAGQATPRVSDAAMNELRRRPWPGNVRELRNAVEHGALVARGGTISTDHLPPPLELTNLTADPSTQMTTSIRQWTRAKLADDAGTQHLYDDFLAAAEPALFGVVLNSTQNNRAAAADVLGIHRATLRKKLNDADRH